MATQLAFNFTEPVVVPDYDQILTNKSNAILDALNEGLKPKEFYKPQYTFQEGNYIVLIACNKEKDVLCNLLDVYGNTPPCTSVNWRNWSIVKQDLKELTI